MYSPSSASLRRSFTRSQPTRSSCSAVPTGDKETVNVALNVVGHAGRGLSASKRRGANQRQQQGDGLHGVPRSGGGQGRHLRLGGSSLSAVTCVVPGSICVGHKAEVTGLVTTESTAQGQ